MPFSNTALAADLFSQAASWSPSCSSRRPALPSAAVCSLLWVCPSSHQCPQFNHPSPGDSHQRMPGASLWKSRWERFGHISAVMGQELTAALGHCNHTSSPGTTEACAAVFIWFTRFWKLDAPKARSALPQPHGRVIAPAPSPAQEKGGLWDSAVCGWNLRQTSARLKGIELKHSYLWTYLETNAGKLQTLFEDWKGGENW